MLSAKSAPPVVTPSGRLTYARIAEVRDGVSVDKFEVPNLIELQLQSFQWFIEKGLRDWSTRSARSRNSPARGWNSSFLTTESGARRTSRKSGRPKDRP